MNISSIIYCRSGSSRLKNKPFIKINKIGLFERVIGNTKKIKGIDRIIVATTNNQHDNRVLKIAEKNKLLTFRGSEKNVLDRTIKCIAEYKIDYFIRICADRIFFDYQEINKILSKKKKIINKYDLITNMSYNKKSVDPGLTIEIISSKAIKKIFNDNKAKKISKEHITKSFYQDPKKFNIFYLKSPDYFYNGFKYTVDDIEDLKRSRYICKKIVKKNTIQKIIKETSIWYEKKYF